MAVEGLVAEGDVDEEAKTEEVKEAEKVPQADAEDLD